MLRRGVPADFSDDRIQYEESKDVSPPKKKDKKDDFDARELELEEQILGITDNILDSLPEVCILMLK